jgi:hypothetical protein
MLSLPPRGFTRFLPSTPETAKPSLACFHQANQEGLMRDCWREQLAESLQDCDSGFNVLQAAQFIRQLLDGEEGVVLAGGLRWRWS